MTSYTSKVTHRQLLDLHAWLKRRHEHGTIPAEATYESVADEATAQLFGHMVGVTRQNIQNCADEIGFKLRSARQVSDRQRMSRQLEKLRRDVDDLTTVVKVQGETISRLKHELELIRENRRELIDSII